MSRTEHLTESMFSNWRAVAIDVQGKEYLIYTGSSFTNVSANYINAFCGGLTLDEQKQIKEINMQRWDGFADCGSWKNKKSLPIPEAAVDSEEVPVLQAG